VLASVLPPLRGRRRPSNWGREGGEAQRNEPLRLRNEKNGHWIASPDYPAGVNDRV